MKFPAWLSNGHGPVKCTSRSVPNMVGCAGAMLCYLESTVARFADFFSEASCITVELTRSYGLGEFREGRRSCVRTGVEGAPVTLLLRTIKLFMKAYWSIKIVLNGIEITRTEAVSATQAWVCCCFFCVGYCSATTDMSASQFG